MDRLLAALTRALDGLLRQAAGLVPPGRQQWAAALRAEADEVPAGAARLGWLAGGLWLIAREAQMVRRIIYALAMSVVAVSAVLVVRYIWGSGRGAGWDTARVVWLAVLAVGLPWVARQRGVFGPVGHGVLARLIRAGGCAAVLAVLLDLTRLQHFPATAAGGWDWPRELAAVMVIAAGLASVLLVMANWPRANPVVVAWCAAAAGLAMCFIVAPVQVLITAYVAGLLALTSRRSPLTQPALAVCTGTGAAGGLLIAVLWSPTRVAQGPGPGLHKKTDVMFLLILLAVVIVAGTLAATTALRARGPGDPLALSKARIRQSLAAGPLTGAAAGLMIPLVRANAAVSYAATCPAVHNGQCTAAPAVWAIFLAGGPLLGLAIGSLAGLAAAGPLPPPPPPDEPPPGEPPLGNSWTGGIYTRST
jgi:hypothetical protein